VVFLQQQLDEKERTIQLLQLQMTKYTNSSTTTSAAARESCNAATQTERVCFPSNYAVLGSQSMQCSGFILTLQEELAASVASHVNPNTYFTLSDSSRE
jgi:hypothetical protein